MNGRRRRVRCQVASRRRRECARRPRSAPGARTGERLPPRSGWCGSRGPRTAVAELREWCEGVTHDQVAGDEVRSSLTCCWRSSNAGSSREGVRSAVALGYRKPDRRDVQEVIHVDAHRRVEDAPQKLAGWSTVPSLLDGVRERESRAAPRPQGEVSALVSAVPSMHTLLLLVSASRVASLGAPPEPRRAKPPASSRAHDPRRRDHTPSTCLRSHRARRRPSGSAEGSAV